MAKEKLAVNLKNAREEKGFTQEQVGVAVGVSQVMVSYYEKGFKEPTVTVLERLAKLFDKTIDELLK